MNNNFMTQDLIDAVINPGFCNCTYQGQEYDEELDENIPGSSVHIIYTKDGAPNLVIFNEQDNHLRVYNMQKQGVALDAKLNPDNKAWDVVRVAEGDIRKSDLIRTCSILKRLHDAATAN